MKPSPIRKAMDLISPLSDLRPDSAGEVRTVMTEQGVRLEMVPPCFDGHVVAVDYCSMTMMEDAVLRLMPESKPFSDREFCEELADYVVDSLLNKAEGEERPKHKILDRGIFGYAYAVQIGNYGLVAVGGNSSTAYISLTGHAFACCDAGLSQRLYQFLMESPTAKMTRIDLCHDDFTGELFGVDAMERAWHDDHFTAQAGNRKRPRFEKRGDWERGDPDQRGRTLYIGARSAGRLIRFYEKGKQLGDQSSPWCRAEVELRNNVFHLVPEMLVNPTGFFVATAPVFARVGFAAKPSRLERIAREGIATVERVIEIIRMQYGVHLDVLRREFYGTDADLLNAICRRGECPPALAKANEFYLAAETASAATT